VTTPPVIGWAQGEVTAGSLICRNCAAPGAKPVVLSLVFKPIRRATQTWRLLSCPACGCCFYEQEPAADYGDDEMLTRGRASLYLQQGAGLAQLIRPVARLRHGPGTRYLDVGCGFGFGLDFVQSMKSWSGLGVDPGQIAALGGRLLGVQIEQRMLQAHEPDKAAAFDVVMAAETIEHVPSPAAFLAVLRQTMKRGGVLVITTPNAELVNATTPASQLVGILSPELHVVLQTRASLGDLLARAGFTYVLIECDGGSLVAYASDAPFALLDYEAAFRGILRRYLEGRIGSFSPNDDLFFGFAGRALLEAANDGDTAQGERLRPMMRTAILERFGIDIERIVGLPPEVSRCSLGRLAALMPLNFAAILYADAMLALAQGASRPSVRARLDCAAAAARALRRAAGELAMEDALSGDLAWVAAAEAMLCAAETGDADVPDRLAALDALTGTAERARYAAMAARCFIGLVNGGHHALARGVLATCGPDETLLQTSLERDFRFCCGIVYLQQDGDAGAAREIFAALRVALAGAPPTAFFWSVLRGEVHALLHLGETDEVRRLCQRFAACSDDGDGFVMPDDLRLHL